MVPAKPAFVRLLSLLTVAAALSNVPAILHAESDESPSDPAPTDSPESSPEEKPAAEEAAEGDAEEKNPAGGQQARPRRGGFVPIWGGRFGGFFRRPVPVPAEDDSENAEGGTAEVPPSVSLPDNGDLRRRLEKIRTLLDERHFAEGTRELGQLLQNRESRDFFLSRDERRRDGRSFLSELRTIIGSLPPEGRELYVTQFEPVARQSLNAAIEAGSEPALREVVARFPATPSGDEALYRLAHRLWEHGRAEAAAGCLQRLRAGPESSDRFEPGLTLLLAACQWRAGQTAPFAASVERLKTHEGSRDAKIAGRPLASILVGDAGPEAWRGLFGPVRGRSAGSDDDWTVFRGSADRNRAVPARPPLLAPRWSVELPLSPHSHSSIDRRVKAHREGNGTHFPMLSPLAIGDLLLVRTGRGVAAWSLRTGGPLWRYPTGDDFSGAGEEDRLWREPGGGSFAADHECFYVVEVGDSVPMTLASVVNHVNQLSAHEHSQGREGRLRWRVGGVDGGNEPALAGISFLGAPLSWRGQSLILAERKGAIALIALDNASGRLAWSQELAFVEETMGTDPFRKVVGATPTISSDDVVICPTSGGAVVAVDLTTQSLLWAYRYSRKPAMTTDPFHGEAPRLDQRDRWLDGTVTIAGDRVLLSPPESAELHCLDRHDGHVCWTKPRGNGLFVGGVSDDRVIVVDRAGMQALSLEEGAAAWPAPLEFPAPALVSGRGVFTGEAYYVPVTSGAILQIDMAEGRVVATHRMIRENALGNLIWQDGVFISQGPEFLQAFDEMGRVERQLQAPLPDLPRTSEELVRAGDLELSRGNVAAAIDLFRRAHVAAPGGAARSRLIAALLDGVRLDLPAKAEFEAELDRLLLP